MILTVTFNPAIDQTYLLEDNLQKEEHTQAKEVKYDTGGKGINVSTYLQALKHETIATGLIGGFTGEYILSELENQNLEHDFVKTGTTRINTTIIAQKGNYKVNQSGSQTSKKVVEKILAIINKKSPAKIVISGSIPPGLDHSAVEKIRKEVSMDVVVDLHGDVLSELKGKYALAKPNRDELSKATGIKVNSHEKCIEASQILIEKGFEKVLASLGSDGAILTTEDKNFYVQSLDCEVVDTTGAGDALLSGVISGLQEGLTEEDALKKGVAFATLAVETSGTDAPKTGKLDDYMDKIEVKKI